MGGKNAKQTCLTSKTVGYYPVKTVLGYKTEYVPYCGNVVQVKRPVSSVIPVPIVQVEEQPVQQQQQKSKMKYSDNDVKIKAKWNGSDLKIKQTCKS